MAINRPWAGLHGDLRAAKSSVYDPAGFTCSRPVPEPESADYAAHRFTLDERAVGEAPMASRRRAAGVR
ncbi:hypothetical protein [Streptomyces sp. NPDC051640]|uniref:hypothetical protein n=1 Tax=Streptomyces sp. NPDC051640 TaxID=3365664 RepID=UPI0037A8AF7F